MSLKRRRLIPDNFGLKRRRERGPVNADPLRGESGNHGDPGAGLIPFPGPASPSRVPDPTSPSRVGARGGGPAGAAVPASPVRGCAPADRAEEPSVQPAARQDGGRPAAGEGRRSHAAARTLSKHCARPRGATQMAANAAQRPSGTVGMGGRGLGETAPSMGWPCRRLAGRKEWTRLAG